MKSTKKVEKRSRRDGITLRQYEDLSQLIAGGLSPSAAAKRLGLSKDTGIKYATKGDPSRGMPPILERVERVAEAVRERVDAKAADRAVAATVTMLDLVDEGKKVLAQALKQRLDTPDLTLPDSLASMAGFAKALHAIDAALHGRPGEIIGVQDGAPGPVDAMLDALTDAERMELYREALPLLEELGYGREGADGGAETIDEWKARTGVKDGAATATVH